MRRTIALTVGALLAAALASTAGATAHRQASDTLVGAGSSLVAPLISVWTPVYDSLTGVQITYGSIGSGGGIAAITARTVDFGASDAPLTPDQSAAAKGVVQIPWALTATAISYNVKGAGDHLRLTGAVLADIYLGKITRWNDTRITKLNPGRRLPDEQITPVYRSDGSGDTYAFTDYLSSVSPNWRDNVGNATLVNFPKGIGGKGNSGVAGVVKSSEGTIGYIADAYVLQNHLFKAALRNNAGNYELPGLRNIAAAASTITKVPFDNRVSIVNPPRTKKLAYPLSTFTYILVPLRSSKAPELRRFVFWALTGGEKYEAKLIFAPIPKVVLVAAEKTLKRVHA